MAPKVSDAIQETPLMGLGWDFLAEATREVTYRGVDVPLCTLMTYDLNILRLKQQMLEKILTKVYGHWRASSWNDIPTKKNQHKHPKRTSLWPSVNRSGACLSPKKAFISCIYVISYGLIYFIIDLNTTSYLDLYCMVFSLTALACIIRLGDYICSGEASTGDLMFFCIVFV